MKSFFSRLFHRAVAALLSAYERERLHPRTRLLEIARDEASNYIRENMPKALGFTDWKGLHRYALANARQAGLYLEFGVAYGGSINWLAEHGGREVHGFDSFEGLPEDWSGRHEAKGAYSTEGRMPAVLPNVKLHKGWFNNTLPDFLQSHPGPVALVHIDCDLYSSTQYLLEALKGRLAVGSILIFDEYFNYISWRDHEYKAFQEFAAKYALEYEYIGWSYQQAAVRVLKAPRT